MAKEKSVLSIVIRSFNPLTNVKREGTYSYSYNDSNISVAQSVVNRLRVKEAELQHEKIVRCELKKSCVGIEA